MKTISIEEYVKDQEAILKQVNEGAKIAITDGQVSAVLVSSDLPFFSKTIFTSYYLVIIKKQKYKYRL